MRDERSTRRSIQWQRHLQEQLSSGNVIVAVAFAALTVVAVAYLAGLHRILPGSGISFTVLTEVTANVRAFMLLGLIAVPFFDGADCTHGDGISVSLATSRIFPCCRVGRHRSAQPLLQLVWLDCRGFRCQPGRRNHRA
jgi:hypothetical protein